MLIILKSIYYFPFILNLIIKLLKNIKNNQTEIEKIKNIKG